MLCVCWLETHRLVVFLCALKTVNETWKHRVPECYGIGMLPIFAVVVASSDDIRCMMMHVFIVPRCQCTTLPVEVVLAWRRTSQSVAGLLRGQGKVHRCSQPAETILAHDAPLYHMQNWTRTALKRSQKNMTSLSGAVPCGQIAFYFLWMAFYLKWLLPLAALGQASHGFDMVWQQRTGETLEREAERLNLLCNASRPASAVHRLVCGFLTFFPCSSWSEHSLQCSI